MRDRLEYNLDGEDKEGKGKDQTKVRIVLVVRKEGALPLFHELSTSEMLAVFSLLL